MKLGERPVISIDGPAGSGKSTLGERLARQLGFLYFDTGAMYRAVTLAALQRGFDVGDEKGLTELAGRLTIDVRPASVDDGRTADVIVDGEDVTWAIRSPEVDANVSRVAAYAGVREALYEQQRRVGMRGRVVMVGRDIGTVVFPEARLKIYLDASVEERARRRYQERVSRGEAANYDEILDAIRQRDQLDTGRKVAPLRPAEDAVVLNSDGLTIEQVLQKVSSLVK